MWPSDLTLVVTLTLNFQGHFGIHYISAKMLIATKQKKNMSFEL